MSSYDELMQQAKALMEQAESVRKAELANVVAEIKARAQSPSATPSSENLLHAQILQTPESRRALLDASLA